MLSLRRSFRVCKGLLHYLFLSPAPYLVALFLAGSAKFWRIRPFLVNLNLFTAVFALFRYPFAHVGLLKS